MELNSDLSSRTNGQFQNLSHLHSLGVPKKIKKATLNVWAPPSGVWEALGSGTISLQQLVSFIDGKYPTCCKHIWLWKWLSSEPFLHLGRNIARLEILSNWEMQVFMTTWADWWELPFPCLQAVWTPPPPSPYYRGGLLTITPHHHCCSAENPAHIIVNADASWISLNCTRTTVSLLAFLAISVHFHTFRKRCRALLNDTRGRTPGNVLIW